ncbi:MAG TPA: Rossmann-like and DUF2520 domain-containing protein [Noviherbaspirillum sp.]|jgi:predicted short-subunit dehydrogenase-like oxidoreductase (DUF2520 family)|uniref:Rossmann-like and DUF2520 domain-containing protein n=1 Tax=Noviherbaspirillum sp. TaxID=1926288 RepID=UPI002F9387E2
MQKRLNIIGGGKVGMTLGRLWSAQQVFAVAGVCNRSLESAANAVAFIGAGTPVAEARLLPPADVWLLSVPDDVLQETADALAASGHIGDGCTVFHCSGALSSSVLAPLAAAGAGCASVHPIRSFAEPAAAAAHFGGTWCGVEGNAQALDILQGAFVAIGGHFVRIDPLFKNVYHGAAVFASNYLVTVLDVAQQAYLKAGIPPDQALQLMEPLVRGTIDNVFRLGTTDALTGPIARGDIGTAVRQYRAIREWDAERGALYKQLAKLTADLARRKRQ